MADGFIKVEPDSTGKEVQTFENTIGGQDVHTQAVVLTNSSGVELTSLPVTGTITVQQSNASNFSATVTSTNASNFLTTVSGTVAANQSGDWNVKSPNASNFLATIAGTVTASQSNASNFLSTIVGTITANQSNASNLLVTASQGGTWNVGSITSLPVNSSFNLNQILSTTIDVNSGTKSAGTQRVVIATDQPQLTNKLLVTPDANSSFNLTQIAGGPVIVAATGVQKVSISGAAGATIDSTTALGAAPTDGIAVLAQYKRSPSVSDLDTQTQSLQSDMNGNLKTVPAVTVDASLSVWNSSTSINTTQILFNVNGASQGPTGAPQSYVVIIPSAGSFAAGAITLEVTYDNSVWVTAPADAVVDPSSTSLAQIALPYTLISATTKSFLVTNRGWYGLRIKLSTAISGTGTLSMGATHLPTPFYVHTDHNCIKGTAIDTSSGTLSAGTQRVVLATDQPALTNKLLVTPDSNIAIDVARIQGQASVASVAGVLDVMPRKRTGGSGLSPSYVSGRINTSTTTTIVAATCYLSSLHMTCLNTGAAWSMKVQDGQATAKTLIPNFVLNANLGFGPLFENPIILSYSEPIICTTGINVVTVGGATGNVDYFATYWQ